MQANYDKYGEICIIDSTYRINLYSAPLLIISGINNEGRNIIFAIAIINNEREETFDWVFREFQKSVKESPCLAMIDEDTALRNSLQKTFTGMSILICLWHIQQNMKKHSAFLNSNDEEKKIKFLIIPLPFVKNKIKFEEDYETIVEYLEKNKHEKTHKYMEAYYAKKERAQLIYVPVIFTTGIHTTSRAESTNSVIKKICQF